MLLPVSVVAGAACDASAFDGMTVSIEGTMTGTYQIQISLDPAASPATASWINEGAALTAAGSLAITKPCAWVRANCTAYTSGTPIGRIAGAMKL